MYIKKHKNEYNKSQSIYEVYDKEGNLITKGRVRKIALDLGLKYRSAINYIYDSNKLKKYKFILIEKDLYENHFY